MMRNHIDQNLRCGADRLPLLLRLIDQRFGFSVKVLGLFDDRSCSIEKIEQRLARWQGLLNLFKLCLAETGNVADELNDPVFHHGLTSLVPHRDNCGHARTSIKALSTNPPTTAIAKTPSANTARSSTERDGVTRFYPVCAPSRSSHRTSRCKPYQEPGGSRGEDRRGGADWI